MQMSRRDVQAANLLLAKQFRHVFLAIVFERTPINFVDIRNEDILLASY